VRLPVDSPDSSEDVVFFDYEIKKDLKGSIIYSELELRPQIYYVDKQDIMMGLRDGIKLMHKMKSNFSFPSHMDLVITVTIKNWYQPTSDLHRYIT
jgi:hypothetical protein